MRHALRLITWLRIIARFGGLRPFEHHHLVPRYLRIVARVMRFGVKTPEVPNYARAFETIGPAAIKLGQILATRPDLVGVEVCNDLRRLQDRLPAFDFALALDAIENALQRPWKECFQSIVEEPVGAASIAQVHRAVTRDGKEVALKILRPGIKKLFARDTASLAWGAGMMEALIPATRRMRPRVVIAMFQKWVGQELNLSLEAANASELAANMAGDTDYLVPKVDWRYTTERLLCIDWIDGVSMTRRDDIIAMGHDLAAISKQLVLTFLKQAIRDGYFHADYHQGNVFVTSDGQLAVCDFGIMGRIDDQGRRYLAEILYGLHCQNYRRVAEIHFEAGYVPDHHDIDDMASALRAAIDPIVDLAADQISIGNLLEKLFFITAKFEMPMQHHLLLLQKTLVMVEGLAIDLNPRINMWETGRDYIESWMREELGPEVRAADGLVSLATSLRRLPDILNRWVALHHHQPRHIPPLPPVAPIPELRPGRLGKAILFLIYSVLLVSLGFGLSELVVGLGGR